MGPASGGAGSAPAAGAGSLRTHSWTEDLGVRPADLAASVESMTESELESTLSNQGLDEGEEDGGESAAPPRTLSAEERLQRTASRRERLCRHFAEGLTPVQENAAAEISPDKPSPAPTHSAQSEADVSATAVELPPPSSPLASPAVQRAASAASPEAEGAPPAEQPEPEPEPEPDARSDYSSDSVDSDEDDFVRRRKSHLTY
eukprot:COSAG04_NODE_8947_length_914_cov_0.833129_1_plen_202_part_01